MKYNIEVRDIEPMRVVYMKYKGVASKANNVFPDVFKSVKGKTNGASFFNYWSLDPETKIGDMELCVPTEEIPRGNGIEVKQMPRTKVVCATHVGPYETLSQAYEAINTYAIQHKVTLTLPFREVYMKGPGMLWKGNPKHYITEIQFPIEEN